MLQFIDSMHTAKVTRSTVYKGVRVLDRIRLAVPISEAVSLSPMMSHWLRVCWPKTSFRSVLIIGTSMLLLRMHPKSNQFFPVTFFITQVSPLMQVTPPIWHPMNHQTPEDLVANDKVFHVVESHESNHFSPHKMLMNVSSLSPSSICSRKTWWEQGLQLNKSKWWLMPWEGTVGGQSRRFKQIMTWQQRLIGIHYCFHPNSNSWLSHYWKLNLILLTCITVYTVHCM